MKWAFLFFIFYQVALADNFLTTTGFQTVLDQHTILKKYKNEKGLFRFRKEVPGEIKFQSYYFFDTRDLFLRKQGAIFYFVNEENGEKKMVFEPSSGSTYFCQFKNKDELIKKLIQGKYPPHLLTEDDCSSNWSHPVTELKKFINKKMRRYRPRKGREGLGVNKITLKGKNTIVKRIIPTNDGVINLEKVLYPRSFISYLFYLKDGPTEKTETILRDVYKITPLKSSKNPFDITLDILENNENVMNNLIKNRIIIR